MSRYGTCFKCGDELHPEWFIDEEYDYHGYPTGRVRRDVSVLICECCGNRESVDDSFAGPWHYPSEREKEAIK